MKLKRFLVPGLMVFFSCLVALGLVEIVLRLIEPESNLTVIQVAETDQGPYTSLRPGVSGVILGRRVSINSEGYRGERRPLHKPPGMVRILFFGDSHTFSMGADDEHTYPAIAEQKLNEAGGQFEALNLGVLGQDMRQIMMHIDRYAFRYDPDVVVFTFHSGDLLESPYDMVQKAADEEDLGFLYRLKRDSMKYSYVARLTIPLLVGLLRNTVGMTPGITTTEYQEIAEDGPTWRRVKAEILELKDRLERQHTKLVFVLYPTMTAFENHPAAPAHGALAAWLVDHGIPVLDLLPSFEGQNASRLTASLLDKHPNERSYEIAGAAVADFLADTVRP